MKRVIALFRWAVINAAFVVALYFGAFRGVEWAGNLFRAGVWLWVVVVVVACVAVFLVAVLAALEMEKGGKAPDVTAWKGAGTPSVPVWLDVTFDICVIGVLAAVAWWWTLVGYVLLCATQFIGRLILKGAASMLEEQAGKAVA